jgi:hypothetical protein
VSCPAAGTCIAVGGDGGPAAVVDELAGTSWSSLATPSAAGLAALRANHPDATLEAVACPATGISCPSVNACVAVGSCAVHSGARYPLVERYG